MLLDLIICDFQYQIDPSVAENGEDNESYFFKILILVVFLLWVALTRYNRRRWGGSGWIDDLKYSAKKDGLTFAKWKYF